MLYDWYINGTAIETIVKKISMSLNENKIAIKVIVNYALKMDATHVFIIYFMR